MTKNFTAIQIAMLRKYFRAMEKEGYLSIDRVQIKEKRYYRHNDQLLKFIHRQTGHLVRQVTGQQIIPSFSYLAAYMKGAELAKHIDRPQCAWNMSLLIDEIPEGQKAKSWPIYLETPRGIVEVRLAPGEATLYQGDRVPHWRPALQGEQRQTVALFHYVPLEFTGSLD